MKRNSISVYFLMVLAFLLLASGCSIDPQPTESDGPMPVRQVGQVPEEFQAVVAENLFHGVTAFEGRVLRAEVCAEDKDARTVVHRVRMMDLYGKELAFCTLTSDDAYHITTLTATADGGFLFVLGFRDYAYNQNEWASDQDFASRVIKCDPAGNVQFDTPFPQTEGSALEFCFEKDGRFFFFGTVQTPDTRTRGTYSPSDIFMTVLDDRGTLLESRCIAGSDFDSLDAAEPSGDGFLLSVSSQSDDGDFTGSKSGGYPVDWVISVNQELEITAQEKASGRAYSDRRIGALAGAAVYSGSALLEDFDAGVPTAVLDYGNFYLIVSENTTGFYESTPVYLSSIWRYTETVYSAYGPDGTLRFRAAVDSSPDYDAIVAGFGVD